MSKVLRQPIQQGDVFLIEVTSIPTSAKPVAPVNGRYQIALGEQSGHHHSFAANKHVTMFRDDGVTAGVGTLFVKITGSKPQTLEHLDADNKPTIDHGSGPVAPGEYEYRPQMQWSDADARPILD